MFGIGTTEFLVIMVVAILVLGPEHLPKIMRTMHKTMADFRRISTEFQRTINLEANQEEYREREMAQAGKSTTVKKKKKTTPAPEAAEEAPLTEQAPPQASADTTVETATGSAPTAQADTAQPDTAQAPEQTPTQASADTTVETATAGAPAAQAATAEKPSGAAAAQEGGSVAPGTQGGAA